MAEPVSHPQAGPHAEQSSVAALVFGAIGVVFGDIGTSPLYTMKETFAGPHPLALDRTACPGRAVADLLGGHIIVSVKYVIVIMRADNQGEGGSLALLALLSRATHGRPGIAALVGMLGVFAAALFYGDSMITPAISVLSAVEGLEVAAPPAPPAVVPLTMAILVVLFVIQSHGTARIGVLFGPVMMLWFTTLAVLGIHEHHPGARSPVGAQPPLRRGLHDRGWHDRLSGARAVVLAVTGAEALYTDMGHFGRLPIRLAWYLLVLPALMLNYFGQGALLLTHPDAHRKPVLPSGPGLGGDSAGRARHHGLRHRLAGGDFRRLLRDAAGYPAGLSAAHEHRPHVRDGDRADLHSGPQLDAGRLRAGARRWASRRRAISPPPMAWP